jgi:hypothetical protein
VSPEKLVEAHGSFGEAHCIECKREQPQAWLRAELLAGRVPTCGCGGLVKPDIVFFGEALPDKFFECRKTVRSPPLPRARRRKFAWNTTRALCPEKHLIHLTFVVDNPSPLTLLSFCLSLSLSLSSPPRLSRSLFLARTAFPLVRVFVCARALRSLSPAGSPQRQGAHRDGHEPASDALL